MEEGVNADFAKADADDEDEAAVKVAGDVGEAFYLVRVVEKVAELLGKRLVVDDHEVACESEDADKDAGEETNLCTVTEMAKTEQANSSSL